MPSQHIEVVLVVVGWVVSFLLGTELASGFLWWRGRRVGATTGANRDRRSRR